MKEKIKRTTIFLYPKQKERLERNKERTGAGLTDQIRRAIDDYLDKEEKC